MNDGPAPWTEADTRSDVFERISRQHSTLMLDYDGTLAPFTRDRLRALPYPGVLPRLETLSECSSVRLVLVTGRPARELQDLVKMQRPVEIWGSHGREQITPAGAYALHGLSQEQVQALDAIEAALRKDGFAAGLERKPASLAVHWRALPPAAQSSVEASVTRLYTQFGAPAELHLLRFDGGLEVRSEAVNKGNVVKRILEETPSSTEPVAYLGDDTTDEDAFRALRGRGLTLLVREEWRPSAAEYWLRPPGELLAFMDAWIAAAQRGA